jgi:hypothetical protein
MLEARSIVSAIAAATRNIGGKKEQRRGRLMNVADYFGRVLVAVGSFSIKQQFASLSVLLSQGMSQCRQSFKIFQFRLVSAAELV